MVEEKVTGAAAAAAAGAAVAKAAPKVPAEIIRGRMPLAVVCMVRFGDNKNDSTGDLAKLFGTTIGKIDDIKKNRNFTYLTAEFKPTQAMKDEGVNWLKKHPEYDNGNVDKLLNELEKMPVASEAEAAAFASIRKKAGGQPATDEAGKAIPAGGGNRKKKAAKDAPAEAPTATTADELLK